MLVTSPAVANNSSSGDNSTNRTGLTVLYK